MSPRGAPRPPHASTTAAHPVSRPWYDPRAPYLVPLVLALAARLDFARRLHFAAEDAYITFRYAENWARGLGPVYNAGERVMGFSSPLWTAWLAVGAVLHVPLLAWARTWSVGFDLGALVLMAALLSREAGRASAWAFACFFAVFPLFSANAVLGMETSLLVFLLAAAARAIAARRGTLAGVALGALALTRPEGLAVALVVAWFAPPRARIVAGAIALAGLAALTAYFGSPVPQSVTAKALTYGVGQRGFALAWIEGFVPAFLHHRWQDLLEGQHLFAVSVVTLPAAVLGVAALARGRKVAFAVALGGLLVLLGYCALGVPYFGWYYVLPLFRLGDGGGRGPAARHPLAAGLGGARAVHWNRRAVPRDPLRGPERRRVARLWRGRRRAHGGERGARHRVPRAHRPHRRADRAHGHRRGRPRVAGRGAKARPGRGLVRGRGQPQATGLPRRARHGD